MCIEYIVDTNFKYPSYIKECVCVCDPGSKKSALIMENFHKNQPKSLELISYIYFKTIKLMFTDIDIYPINNKTDHISEEYIFYRKEAKQKLIFS